MNVFCGHVMLVSEWKPLNNQSKPKITSGYDPIKCENTSEACTSNIKIKPQGGPYNIVKGWLYSSRWHS